MYIFEPEVALFPCEVVEFILSLISSNAVFIAALFEPEDTVESQVASSAPASNPVNIVAGATSE